MNTIDVHRHIENLERIAWYNVSFPDKGAGATRCHAFLQADSEESARSIASEHDHFNMYDTSKGTVERVGPLWSDVETQLVMAGGPNVAIGQGGEKTTKGDL